MQRVYANVLTLVPPEDVEHTADVVDEAASIIDAWSRDVLDRNGGKGLEFTDDGERQSAGSTWVERLFRRGEKATYMRLFLEHEGGSGDGRRWRTNVVLGSYAGVIEVSVKLLTGFRPGVVRPQGTHLVGQPGLVGQLTDRFQVLKGGQSVTNDPIWFDANGSVKIDSRIKSPERSLPIIIVYDPDQGFVDVDRLAYQVRGLATVAVARDAEALETLRYPLGVKWVPPFPHVRTFWPGFHWQDPAHKHPLLTERHMKQVRDRGRDVTRMVSSKIHQVANLAPVQDKVARKAQGRIAEELMTEGATTQADRLKKENETLRLRAENAEAMAEDWRERYEHLHQYMLEQQIPAPDEAVEEPFDVEDALAGCVTAKDVIEVSEQQQENLEFLDSAYKNADKDRSRDKDLRDLYEAFHALDRACSAFDKDGGLPQGDLGDFFDFYRANHYSDLPKYTSHDSQTAKQKHGASRTVMIDGEKVQLEKHFTVGTGSPDRCMHVYFEVYPKDRRAVIGYCGRHLGTKKY